MGDPADAAAAAAVAQHAYQQLNVKRIELARQLTENLDTSVLQNLGKIAEIIRNFLAKIVKICPKKCIL